MGAASREYRLVTFEWAQVHAASREHRPVTVEWAQVHTVRERATNFHHAIRVGENEVLDRAANFRLRRAQKRVLHADAVVFGLRVHVVQPQGLLVSNSALLQSFFAGASHGRCACLAPA